MFFGISSMILASMIDTIYIGWIGTQQLAAVSFSFPLVMGLSSVSMGLGIGATSIMSRTLGRGDRTRAYVLGTHTLLLVLILVHFACDLRPRCSVRICSASWARTT